MLTAIPVPDARTRTGQLIPTPPHVTPEQWAAFARHIAVIGVDGCHLWTGDLRGDGYGRHILTVDPVDLLDDSREVTAAAHRYAYVAAHGTEAVGPLVGHTPEERKRQRPVLHRCDEPLCVRVEHLTVGTAVLNAADRQHRGRAGSRRHGVVRHGADTRPRYQRSVEMQTAVRWALRLGLEPALVEIVAAVAAAGDPHHGQLSLLPIPEQRGS